MHVCLLFRCDVCVFVLVGLRACMLGSMYVCVCVFLFACMRVCVYVCVCVFARLYVLLVD